jgi:hypothetical protein
MPGTFVFLHIPDDPATVYFSVCVPNLDVLDDDETRPPPESWHDKAEKLDTWAVEYDDMTREIQPRSTRNRTGTHCKLSHQKQNGQWDVDEVEEPGAPPRLVYTKYQGAARMNLPGGRPTRNVFSLLPGKPSGKPSLPVAFMPEILTELLLYHSPFLGCLHPRPLSHLQQVRDAEVYR